MAQLTLYKRHYPIMKNIFTALLLLIALLPSATITAQTTSKKKVGTLSGTIVSEGEKEPLPNAAIQLFTLPDTVFKAGNASDLEGKFTISVEAGEYLMRITYVGFLSQESKVKIAAKKTNNIGEVLLKPDVVALKEATVTAAIKNIAMSYPPASIHGYPKKSTGIHEDLHGFIRCFAKKVPIDLSIISLDKAMIGTGPSDGLAVDTPGLLIASTDPVAADCIGARLLGFLPQAVCYLYGLYKDGLGEARPENMTMVGLHLIEAEKIFSNAAYGKKDARVDKEKLKDIHGN